MQILSIFYSYTIVPMLHYNRRNWKWLESTNHNMVQKIMILFSGKKVIGYSRLLFPMPWTEKATKLPKKVTNLKNEISVEAMYTQSAKIPERRNHFMVIQWASVIFFFPKGAFDKFSGGMRITFSNIESICRRKEKRIKKKKKILTVIWTRIYLLEDLEGFKGMATWNIY